MSPNVLVVDDEPDLRLLVELHLAPEYGVSGVGTGEEALRRVQEEQFDAVLLDLRLPGIDGLTVLAELRNRQATKSLPVIVITAHGGGEAEERCREVGSDGFLTKPFTAQQLRGAIDSVLSPAA